jgi:hypothetical protein
VLITSSRNPGDLILLQSVVDGIRQEESWRKSYEESWSNDLDGHRYRVRTVEIREMHIAGTATPVRLLEGTDESGRPVKEAVCILPGKAGDVLVGMMSGVDTWNIEQVQAFYGSIR